MKILCLIDCLGQGGAEHQIICLTYMLKQAGYDVELAYYYEENFYESLICQYDIKAKLLPSEGNGKLTKLSVVRDYIRNNHFTHLITYKEGASEIGCILKFLGLRIKLIVSERNTTQSLSRRDKLRFFMYRWADYVVPNSYSQKNFICEHFSSLSKKTIAITNFIDMNVFKPKDEVHEYNENSANILVACRVSRQKNTLNFMKALELVKEKGLDVHVDWFGNIDSGESDYGVAVKEYYEKSSLNSMLTFHPATTKIKEEYQKCDVFCLPSIYEGYPNVVCEAMSSGKPVLCSNVCDNPLIVEEGVNGFMFNPTDITSIANAIVRFCNLSIVEKKTMANKSLVIAKEMFSPKAFTDKYIELL